MTDFRYTSAETVRGWATRAQEAGDAAEKILVGIQSAAVQERDPGLATALQAAMLLLAEARVFPRMMIEECDFADRVDARIRGEDD